MDYILIKSEVVFKGRMIDVKVDEIEYKNGNTGFREVVSHPGGAAVVPVTDDGKVILISQFRYPFQTNMLEIPAGKLDENEDPMVCARRELEEETGYKTNYIEKLGAVVPTPGYCNEVLHLFLAKDLVAGDHSRDEGEESMEMFEFSFDEIENKIKSGEIQDSKTICAIYMAKKVLF